MRILAALSLLIALGLMALAAYGGAATWKAALYLDVLAWTLLVLQILALGLERVGAGLWSRAGVATAAGAMALGLSHGLVPGRLPELAFHDVHHAGVSLLALGLSLGALGLGGLALRLDKRAPGALGGVAMLLALLALRGWLPHGG